MQNGDTLAVGLLEEVPKVTGCLLEENGVQVEEIGDWLSSSLKVEKAVEEYQLDPFPLPVMLMLLMPRIRCRC